MPEKVAHEYQACHNENLALVDAELASLGHPDIAGHDQRRILIGRHLSSGGKNIRRLFETLYSECRRARYECTMVNAQPETARKTAHQSVKLLKQIKSKL
ncbi:MAG: hypothetical protein AB1700_01730 [Bacillota bacterium]